MPGADRPRSRGTHAGTAVPGADRAPARWAGGPIWCVLALLSSAGCAHHGSAAEARAEHPAGGERPTVDSVTVAMWSMDSPSQRW